MVAHLPGMLEAQVRSLAPQAMSQTILITTGWPPVKYRATPKQHSSQAGWRAPAAPALGSPGVEAQHGKRSNIHPDLRGQLDKAL